jgi:predicted dienelactone hydrolase
VRHLIASFGSLLAIVAVSWAAGPGPVQAAAAPPDAGFAAPGKYAVQTVLDDWKDPARDREVPVKIYYPKTGRGPCPVIVFSHGLGGSREGYEYLGRQWASHGYVSVHVQHKGSDTDVWKGNARPMDALRAAAKDPSNAVNRPADVRFAIDKLTKMNRQDGPLAGRLDMARVGAAGHSFGAYTTLAVAGEVFVGPFGRGISVADPRVKAAIPMSSPVPRRKETLDRAFGSIKIPCLHMTGTEDSSPIGDTPKEDRRLPFDHSKGPDQYLVIFNGGDHMIFSGRGRLAGNRAKDARFQELICAATTAFWDAYLRGDAKAEAWLAGGGFQSMMGRDGTLEKRLKAAEPAGTR